MGAEHVEGKREKSTADKSLDAILESIDVNGSTEEIAGHLSRFFRVNNPSLKNGQLYRWITTIGVPKETAREVLTVLKNKEGQSVIDESHQRQLDLGGKLDRISQGLLCVQNEFPLDQVAKKLRNTKHPTEQQQYNQAVFRVLTEKNFTQEEIKNVLIALKDGIVDSKNAKAIASSMSQKNFSYTAPNPEKEGFTKKYTTPHSYESQEEENYQEKYALFGNSKQDIYNSLQEMKEKGVLSEVQEKILFSAQNHLYDVRYQKAYWEAGDSSTSFINGEKTPTCGGGVAYHLKQAGIPIPKNPLWAENFSKGGEKISKEKAIPGDIVVYRTRIVNGKDVGGHVGIVMGYENGQMLVWSENIGVASDTPGEGRYIGPIIHPIDGLTSMGISEPSIYRHR